jgi:lactate dehydrogenase-like 2-hydroxyacid dehydrogenase
MDKKRRPRDCRVHLRWCRVVRCAGRGAANYWNSNARKAFHARHGHGIGTGQIDRKDAPKLESLKMNLLYLAKASQYLMIKGAENVRTFDMGKVPEKLKQGRPRIDCLVGLDAADSAEQVRIGISALRY